MNIKKLRNTILKRNHIYIKSKTPLNIDKLKNIATLGFDIEHGKRYFELFSTNFNYNKVFMMPHDYVFKFDAHDNYDNYLYEIILKSEKVKQDLINRNENGQPEIILYFSDIARLSLIISEKQFDRYNKKKYNRTINDKISSELFQVLKSYMAGFGEMEKEYYNSFQKFKLNRKLILFRGLSIDKYHKNFKNFKKNKIINLNLSHSSSWTTNLVVADDFAVSMNGFIGVIITATIFPQDIIIDTRLLPSETLDSLYTGNQREIIVKPGKYKGRIISINENL